MFLTSVPPFREEGRTVAEKVMAPFRNFASIEAAGGLTLVACAVLALVWANSPWQESYHTFWDETYLSVGLGGHTLSLTLHHWINDGLMAVFFFMVGLEIKRELLVGEIASPRRAALPVAAALGGMVVPAAIYALFNLGGPGAHGWGIPMATDIAFALGVLTLLGSRVPIALKVFLTALAIVDDIGAVLVIALFYTPEITASWLWAALGVLALLVVFNWAHVRPPQAYALASVVLWYFCLRSGIHASVAGVLAALTVPARTRCPQERFVRLGREFIEAYRKAGERGGSVLSNPEQMDAIEELEAVSRRASTPLQRIEHQLHPWVAFAVMPLFALANAGISFTGESLGHLTGPVSLGVFFGLVAGKQIGVTLGGWLAVRLGAADLPEGLGVRHLYGASCLASVGFTMSMFIANLAYPEPLFVEQAKLAVLAASAVAAVWGYGVLRAVLSGGR